MDNYLPVGFTRGVILGGLDAPTGGHSQANPHPVLIRLIDDSILPNRYRGKYRECLVVGAGYGDISAERGYVRTESLNCIREGGRPLTVQFQGAVWGEDGKLGLRGRLVSKQGQMLANALMTGILSGLGEGISAANTTYSTSALGTVGTQSGTQALRGGMGSGIGRAMDRLAQYYIKLAEQTFPVIEIDAGRIVDVVVTRGVRIDDADEPPGVPAQQPLPNPLDPTHRYFQANYDSRPAAHRDRRHADRSTRRGLLRQRRRRFAGARAPGHLPAHITGSFQANHADHR
ncbi:MAG TPA: TraB/VirB10 family protein [Burkholderiaceae bacterium]|nr:TraB/VirB10 family protein [Burkholderiaceae bacterium]